MKSLLDDKQRKSAAARLILAQVVLLDAPNDVIQSLKSWCRSLTPGQENNRGEEQKVGVADSVKMELQNVGGEKHDA